MGVRSAQTVMSELLNLFSFSLFISGKKRYQNKLTSCTKFSKLRDGGTIINQ